MIHWILTGIANAQIYIKNPAAVIEMTGSEAKY